MSYDETIHTARCIYDALTHAESDEQGPTEVGSVYSFEDCAKWLKKDELPDITPDLLRKIKAVEVVPNALIRRAYNTAMENCSHDEDRYDINRNIRVALNHITGERLSQKAVTDRIRYGLGFSTKHSKKGKRITAIFMPTVLAEAIVKALDIEPYTVGV